MFKIFRRYYFYINAIHYALCKQYECNNNFLLRIIDKIIMFFLPQKYFNIVSERRKYYECKNKGKLDFFAFKASLFYIVVLLIPLSLLLANVISLLLPIDMFYLYGIIELLLTFPVWKNIFNEKVLNKQFVVYEKLSKKYSKQWRLLLFSIIILDIFLIILLNLI